MIETLTDILIEMVINGYRVSFDKGIFDTELKITMYKMFRDEIYHPVHTCTIIELDDNTPSEELDAMIIDNIHDMSRSIDEEFDKFVNSMIKRGDNND
jgi:hypothetical protein